MYFFLHKFWIWQTLLWIFFLIAIFILIQKHSLSAKKISNFMHGFKSAILEKLKNCQNGTFEPLHEIWKSFWPKSFSSSIMKMAIRKNIHKMSQGPPNPGFMQAKVQKGDFLKRPSRELKKKCFRFLRISWRPGTQKRGIFFAILNPVQVVWCVQCYLYMTPLGLIISEVAFLFIW